MLHLSRRSDVSVRYATSIAQSRLAQYPTRHRHIKHVYREYHARQLRRKASCGFLISRGESINESKRTWTRPNVRDYSTFKTPDSVTKEAQDPEGETVDSDEPKPLGAWTTLQERLRQSQLSKAKAKDKNAREDEIAEEEEDDDGGERILPPKSRRNRRRRAASDSDKEPKERKPKAASKKEKEKEDRVYTHFHPAQIKFQPLATEEVLDVPQLSHNLDRVLFNPGVYQMQDERSRVFNFDPYLASIMPVEEFDFDALREYVTSSKDVKLRQLSAENHLKYCGSTSSMTSILSHFHFLLSAWRKPNFGALSRSFVPDSTNFTGMTRAPVAAFLHHHDGVYAIDADKEFDTANVLSKLGHSMEKVLTLPKEEFEKYRKSRAHKFSEEERNAGEAFHYTKIGDFLLRSQLDAHDPRLPGTGMFDLKTRAVVTIRMDVTGYEKGRGYELRRRFGQWESFEREYYDMIRAAFLKYSLQVRMGRMDGIFVAYHNTRRIFGFQYISLAEMDSALHGTTDPRLGDEEFKASIKILNDLLDRATQRFPGRTLRLHFETRDNKSPVMYFFAEPVSEEQMKSIQESKKPAVEDVERHIRRMSDVEAKSDTEKGDSTAGQKEKQVDDATDSFATTSLADSAWEKTIPQLRKVIGSDASGTPRVREAILGALEEYGLGSKTDSSTEQHLDSLTEALTFDLHQASKTEEDVQEKAWEDEQEVQDEPTETVAENDEPEEFGTESRENLEVSALPEESQPAEITQPEPEAETDAEVAYLENLILKVMDEIDPRAPHERLFNRRFASLVEGAENEDAAMDSPESTVDSLLSDEDQAQQPSEKVDNAQPQDAAAAETEQVPTKATKSKKQKREVLGLCVTVKHKVNGEPVERPEIKSKGFRWNTHYLIEPMNKDRMMGMYDQLRSRRSKIFNERPEDRDREWYKMFGGKLKQLNEKGEQFRQHTSRSQQSEGVLRVSWDKEPHDLTKFDYVPETRNEN